MKKIITYSLLLLLLVSSATEANALSVRISGNRLSLHADRVFLREILDQIAKMGVAVRVDPQLNPKITASFENRDIQEGIASILKGYNHVLIWQSIGGPSGSSITRLAEIQVYRPGRKELMERLVYGKNFRIARNPKDGSLYVGNEILLRIKPGMSLSEFEKLMQTIGGLIVDQNPSQGIYRIRFPGDPDIPSIANEISAYRGIEKAEPNFVYPISIPYKGPAVYGAAGDDRISAPEGAAPVAVLDTGLAPDSGLENVVLASFDAVNPEDPIADDIGHGTQMALIAAGVVKPHGVSQDSEDHIPLIPIRAFDDNGFTSNFTIMQSIDFAIKNGARVLSLSWGSETRSSFLEDALEYAVSKDLIIVASAGNKPTGRETYPAAYPAVLGVGASTPDGKSWENSNYGDFVALYAPGFATLPVGYKGDPGLYAGTSISAAYTANRIAEYLSGHPGATRNEVLKYLSGLAR